LGQPKAAGSAAGPPSRTPTPACLPLPPREHCCLPPPPAACPAGRPPGPLPRVARSLSPLFTLSQQKSHRTPSSILPRVTPFPLSTSPVTQAAPPHQDSPRRHRHHPVTVSPYPRAFLHQIGRCLTPLPPSSSYRARPPQSHRGPPKHRRPTLLPRRRPAHSVRACRPNLAWRLLLGALTLPLTSMVTTWRASAPRVGATGQPGHFGLWSGPAVPNLGPNSAHALFILLPISKFIFSIKFRVEASTHEI
jgi:hypothetical protein